MKIKYLLKNGPVRRGEQFKPEKLIPFGSLRSDHMFLMDYNAGKWKDPRIIPYTDISLPPGSIGLNYAQSVFEGAKAFKHKDGEIYLFRIDQHADRFNKSAERLCMPIIPVNDQISAIKALIDIERLWFPEQKGATFYIRPIMFATEDSLTVKPSKTYTYCIFLSPSGAYYPKGFNPIKIFLTNKYKRVAPGGIGKAKSGVNYSITLEAIEKAKKLNAQQVLYLDPTNTFVEEGGVMNHFHVTDNEEIIIPVFDDSIMESVTAKSFLELTKELGCPVKQQKVLVKDFIQKIKEKRIVEAGGLGTAAVVSPVGSYVLENGEELIIGNGKVGSITKRMYGLLTGIQKGKVKSPKGWLQKVPRLVKTNA